MPASGQEIEAKFYVNNLDTIKTRLQKLEARLIQPRVLETNIRFDLPNGGLRSEGRVLRLRQDSEARLTYKSASNNDQGVLSRTEIEITIEDFGRAKQLLEALGYQPIFIYEKFRTTYRIQTSEVLKTSEVSVLVMLDELPFGNLVEIEGGSMEAIREISDLLGLDWDATIAKSYHALFEHLKAEMSLPFRDLLFENFTGVYATPIQLGVHQADSETG